jgi:hypothetical protein
MWCNEDKGHQGYHGARRYSCQVDAPYPPVPERDCVDVRLLPSARRLSESLAPKPSRRPTMSRSIQSTVHPDDDLLCWRLETALSSVCKQSAEAFSGDGLWLTHTTDRVTPKNRRCGRDHRSRCSGKFSQRELVTLESTASAIISPVITVHSNYPKPS